MVKSGINFGETFSANPTYHSCFPNYCPFLRGLGGIMYNP
ncbi:hypothetical protein CWATWH8502_3992 [Crocosphaera watsonii WH 8502]|uniref:Uncharacterized protein n=1 Tax=Crocosphaera watsonii WH 8502 TaxID=423474 RepID=T2I9H9_CROWT|nr:hypothetical protein CWATWH8502_3992 [Crocosphaera watsonii WH 8502]